MNLERRLWKLEAQIQTRQPSWTSDAGAARARVAARARLKIGEALNAPCHPAVKSAPTLLINNTPAQVTADLEILQRWGRQHPEALAPDDDTLTRITARLEEMARRLEAYHEP